MKNIEQLSKKLGAFAHKSDPQDAQTKRIAVTAKGFLNRALDQRTNSEKRPGVTLTKLWPLNDVVMKSMVDLASVTSTLCQKSKVPFSPDGTLLSSWKSEKGAAGKSKPSSPTMVKLEQPHPPSIKKSSSNPTIMQTEPKPPKQLKNDNDLFPSTGNKTRDHAIKVFAHSLLSSATPFEIAVDIEQALYQSCGTSNESKNLSNEYYIAVKSLWESLSVDVRVFDIEPFLNSTTIKEQFALINMIFLNAEPKM
jgi:hypothetical protein